MTAIMRSDLNSGVLQTWLRKKALETYEPNVFFAKFGVEPMIEDGYNTLSWPKFDQIATSSVSTLSDGVSPSDTDFDATVVSVTPTQYGVVVNMADMMVERSKIDFLAGAAGAVGKSMARKLDEVVQTTIMAGTNVFYGGVAANRAALTSTEVLTAGLLNRAQALLKSNDATAMPDGSYVCVIHPYQLYDLRAATAAGSWIDVNKYNDQTKVFDGEIGKLHGVRVVVSSHVQSFTSTTTVYPALVMGAEAFGVGKAQNLEVLLTPKGAIDSDPLAQRRKVGGKAAFGTTILQQDGLVRIETGATDIS